MPLHLMKLCVGAGSIAELEEHIDARLAACRAEKRAVEQIHTTRMVPKRLDDLLDGGSLYWVIKGAIAARQELRAVRPFTDPGGIGRCHLVLDPVVVPVMPRPCRPFQGWRYLDHASRPADLRGSDGTVALPEHLRFALRELCLI